MPVTAHQAVSHYQERQRQAMELIEAYEHLARECREAIAEAQAERQEVTVALAAAYLPRLEREALAAVESRTGYLGFSRRDPLAAMAHEHHVLETAIARIAADERYQTRDLLAGVDGTLTTKLAEVREHLALWETECQPFEQLEMFLELIAVKYDTPEFDVAWWKGTYWKYWAAGDRICSALGMKDFGDDVLPAYRKVAEQRDFWLGEAREIEAQVRGVHELVQQHDQAVARLANLEEIYLRHCHTLLAEYLCGADLQLLDEWHRGELASRADDERRGHQGADRAVTMGLRTIAGLQAKISMLGELESQGLKSLVEDLQRRAHKYARKAAKFWRPKYLGSYISERELDPAFDEKYHKLNQRHGKLAVLVQKIRSYDEYERFDLHNDTELWWREFTGKRPTRMTPGLRRWYDRNPEARPSHSRPWDEDWSQQGEPDRSFAQAVATAAIARDVSDSDADRGYLS